MTIGLAIFAKNSNLSPVKTRLAETVGVDAAIEFYRLSLAAVTENVKEVQSYTNSYVNVYWALAEQESIHLPEWQCFDTLWTGEGELGERLHNVYSTLLEKHEAVIIIGSDSPCMPQSIIYDAIECLQATEGVVFSGVSDGGFCLMAGNVPIDKQILNSVKYSEKSTLADLSAAIAAHKIAISYIQEHFDVDRYNDLHTMLDYINQHELSSAAISDIKQYAGGVIANINNS
jgi:hypothetical protein